MFEVHMICYVRSCQVLLTTIWSHSTSCMPILPCDSKYIYIYIYYLKVQGTAKVEGDLTNLGHTNKLTSE